MHCQVLSSFSSQTIYTPTSVDLISHTIAGWVYDLQVSSAIHTLTQNWVNRTDMDCAICSVWFILNMLFYVHKFGKLTVFNSLVLWPGIEPRPRRWELRILATRPSGTVVLIWKAPGQEFLAIKGTGIQVPPSNDLKKYLWEDRLFEAGSERGRLCRPDITIM